MLRFASPALTIEGLLGSAAAPAIDVVGLTAERIAADYAARRYTAVELTRAFLARIARLEPRLNAFIVLNDRVLEGAAAADARLAAGERGPLLGVPIAAKDNMNQVGFRTTAGYAGFAADNRVVDPARGTFNGLDLVPTRDATLIARLEAAGAIVLGKTTCRISGSTGCAPTRATPATR
jgi:Asp-tRNA(Asn)/Glu-tRNA(Gln) amidotransferase A subunit family amidase